MSSTCLVSPTCWEKLQKKLDAELRDAQEDENNTADPIFFKGVCGTTWCLVPDNAVREPRIPTRFDVRPASVELPPKIAAADHSGPRQVYIRAAVELARYGYTPNCADCEAAQAGVPGFVKHQTEECKACII